MDAQTPYFDFVSANDELAGYFGSLPKNVQETIVQAHGDIKTVGELQSIAEGLMGKS